MFTVPVLDIKSDPLDVLLAVIGYRLSMLADSDNEDVSRTVHEQRELQAARYIEHTPVYDDDYQPRFQ